MQKITFVIPSRNNLEFLQLAYTSIRNLDTKHEVLVLNDASTDGTQEWIEQQNDKDLIVYHNPGPDRIGIVGMFDKGIEMATTDIIMAYHADMVAGKDLDKNILKHLPIKTADGKPSAHFEHNIAIVAGKPKLLSTFQYIYDALGIKTEEEVPFK